MVVAPGHFNPMVPLARAFEAAGHAVAFATDPEGPSRDTSGQPRPLANPGSILEFTYTGN